MHRRESRQWAALLTVPSVFLIAGLFKSNSPGAVIAILAVLLFLAIIVLSVRSVLRFRSNIETFSAPAVSRATQLRRAASESAGQDSSRVTRPISKASSLSPLAPGSSLGDLLVRLRADFAADATARHVAFDFRMHGGLEQAPLDVLALQMVLGHLIENALHHAPGGSIIELRATPSSDGRIARLSVADDGNGVSPSARASLFTHPQLAIDASASTVVRARSLVACREKLERLGGSIAYESRSPHGSRFVVELPIDASFLGIRRSARGARAPRESHPRDR